MQILEFNMSQLNEVQRGVSGSLSQAFIWCHLADLCHVRNGPIQLVHQNTSLKKDLNAAERKLSERKERIINLERLVASSEYQLKAKDAEYQKNVRDLHDQVMQLQAREQSMSVNQGLGFGRIAKPLRGK